MKRSVRVAGTSHRAKNNSYITALIPSIRFGTTNFFMARSAKWGRAKSSLNFGRAQTRTLVQPKKFRGIGMKKWFVVAVIAGVAELSSAQTKLPEKKALAPASDVKQAPKKERAALPTPEPKKVPIPKFSMTLIEGDRIDPAYEGMRVVDVVDAIDRLTVQKKGEFESTADFSARKTAALSGKILGDSAVEDIFAFVLPVGKGSQYQEGLRYDFNADTSEVRLFVLPKLSSMKWIGAPDYQTNLRPNSELDQFDLDSKLESQSTYQGSNAYGATVTVKKTSMSQVGIAANPIPFLNFKRRAGYSNPFSAVQFNLENSKAARELPALKALVALKLTDPYIFHNFVHVEPTRDSPTDITIQAKYLSGNILGIVFYSGVTGEVFARIPASFGKAEPKPENKPVSQ